MNKISLDYNFASAKYIDGGIDGDILEQHLEKARYGFSRLKELEEKGEVGFPKLPGLDTEPLKALAKEIHRKFNDLVVIGIGGSSLGFEAIVNALLPYGYNSLSFSDRRGFPRVWLLDNSDPSLVAAVTKYCNQEDTFVVVVSKSGRTVESAANFSLIIDWLKEESVPLKKHVVAVTDPENGTLAEFVKEHELKSFPIEPSIGGRYSVLSPAGLLPAAILGLDIDKMLDGAADVRENYWKHFLTMSAIYMHYMNGYPVTVMMPYTSKLVKFSEWFCQLWAESLGKKNGHFVSSTPLRVAGAIDQHSQIQQFIDGVKDKFITFIGLAVHDQDTSLKGDAHPDYAYLNGHKMGELLNNELLATETSLLIKGVPSMKLTFSRMDEYMMGQLFMLYQYVVAITGLAYDINPFDQPAVEEGKEIMYGLMGREEYKEQGELVKKYARAPEFII